MLQSDRLLLAILQEIPTDSDKLNIDDFNEELKRMGIGENSKEYAFLFNNKLLNISESNFLPIGPQVKNLFDLDETNNSFQFKIKTGKKNKYVYLTDSGKILLDSLQSEYLKNKFSEIYNKE